MIGSMRSSDRAVILFVLRRRRGEKEYIGVGSVFWRGAASPYAPILRGIISYKHTSCAGRGGTIFWWQDKPSADVNQPPRASQRATIQAEFHH